MTQHLLFDAAGMKLAVPSRLIKAIHEPLAIQAVNGTCNWFLGLAVVHGKLLPVSDLGAFCGQMRCTGRTLELDPDVAIAGLRVDFVSGLCDEQPTPTHAATQLGDSSVAQLKLTGQSVRSNNDEHLIVDMHALVNSAEFINVGES